MRLNLWVIAFWQTMTMHIKHVALQLVAILEDDSTSDEEEVP
jgi:hypothetical protein